MVYAGIDPTPAELAAMYGDYPIHAELNPLTRVRYLELLETLASARITGNLLDAGSGAGHFLDVATEKGWTAHGSEYDVRMVKACRQRGFRMHQGALDAASFQEGSFDVITSFEVLEHLTDPLGELRNFHRFLRPDGLLYLTTPNFNSISRAMAGSRWSVVNYPEHLNYFVPRTLGKALGTTGFRIIRTRTTGISPSRLLRSRGADMAMEENTVPNNSDQRMRAAIERSWYLKVAKSMTNGILSALGRGDTIKVLCRRV